MIEVHITQDGLMVKGHAGYAPSGQDIVCAAISTLVQVFIASVEQLTTDNLKCDISAGNAVIRYRNLTESAHILLDSFFIGIRAVADEYPDYIKIEQACNS